MSGEDRAALTLAMGDEPLPSSGTGLPLVDRRHYEIGEEIARGGWGRVLRAYDRRLGRTVAIKQLRVASADVEARLQCEASLTARLEHPAIVPVHEVGRWASGESFYAMKLVEGRTLHEVLAAATTLDARLLLVPHVLAVADAMAYAHARGIVHRDLKPSNILVADAGRVWSVTPAIGPRLPPFLLTAARASAPGAKHRLATPGLE